MIEAFMCDFIRTPIGRYGGALAQVRADDLAALPLRVILARNPGLDPAVVEEVRMGCANPAGEGNRPVTRMALPLAGLPENGAGCDGDRGGVHRRESGAGAAVRGACHGRRPRPPHRGR